MDDAHRRPDGVDDATVAAAGKLSEAMEWIERARGRLYDLHQMVGRADFLIEEAADAFEAAGHGDAAEELRGDALGRNVLDGRWTYQIVEEFEDTYYEPIRATERGLRERLVGGRRHLLEAEMKERRRTRGRSGHEAEPPGRHGD